MIQYNTIQYNTIQYNTIQFNTIQYILYFVSRLRAVQARSKYVCEFLKYKDLRESQHLILP